jgi:lysyl-tRNA synthetase class 2
VNTWERYKTDDKFRRNIEIRQKVMESIRDFFAFEGFVEVEAPLLVSSPDLSPNLTPFSVEVENADGKKYPAHLITSPEFSMKKMLAAGMEKIFSLGKVFRNQEPFGPGFGERSTHNPEFTMLEWYRAGADYNVLMEDTERLVRYCAKAITLDKSKSEQPNSEEKPTKRDFDFSSRILEFPRWKRLSLKEAFAEIGLNLDELLTRDTMAKAAADRGYRVSEGDTFDDCFFKIFLTEIEPKLGVTEPVILYDYPIQMAALARPKPGDPRYAERFEAYAGGMELCNCFSELTDPTEQRRRFEEEREERHRLGKEAPPIDEDLLSALGSAPASSGNAMGVDRLVMLLAGVKNIEDVTLFPAGELFKPKLKTYKP